MIIFRHPHPSFQTHPFCTLQSHDAFSPRGVHFVRCEMRNGETPTSCNNNNHNNNQEKNTKSCDSGIISKDNTQNQRDKTSELFKGPVHFEESNEVISIALDLPGFQLNNLNVIVDDKENILTISGKRTNTFGYTYTLHRRFRLHKQRVVFESANAKFVDDILTVTFQKHNETGPRIIPITSEAESTSNVDNSVKTDDSSSPDISLQMNENERNLQSTISNSTSLNHAKEEVNVSNISYSDTTEKSVEVETVKDEDSYHGIAGKNVDDDNSASIDNAVSSDKEVEDEDESEIMIDEGNQQGMQETPLTKAEEVTKFHDHSFDSSGSIQVDEENNVESEEEDSLWEQV